MIVRKISNILGETDRVTVGLLYISEIIAAISAGVSAGCGPPIGRILFHDAGC